MNDNRKRVLAEVISLDAWHEPFTLKRERAKLHVDVTFLTGRIGGGATERVRFKLRLKRAEIVVVVPPNEPAVVEKASVARDTPRVKVSSTTSSKSQINREIGGTVGAKAKLSGVTPAIGGAAKASAKRTKSSALKLTESLDGMRITQAQTSDGDYMWVVEPVVVNHLVGHPWDAANARLRVIDKRPDRSKGIPPTVRVEVRCRREDLEITDIAPTDPSVLAALLKDPMGKNKLAAAEAVIRTRLFQAGLFSGDMADPYAQMTLSVATAEAQ